MNWGRSNVKLKRPERRSTRNTTTRLFRKSRGTERCQNRPEVTGRSAPTAVKEEYTSDLRPSTVRRLGQASVVQSTSSGVSLAWRRSTLGIEVVKPVVPSVSGSRFRQSVHRRSHLRGARREAVKTDPSSAIEREFL